MTSFRTIVSQFLPLFNRPRRDSTWFATRMRPPPPPHRISFQNSTKHFHTRRVYNLSRRNLPLSLHSRLPRSFLAATSTGRELRTAAEKEINREEEGEREWFLHALFTAESFYSPTTGIVAGNKDINRGSRGTIQGLPFQEAGQFEQTFGEVIYALRTIIIEAPHENASTYLSFVSGRATRLEKPAGSVLMLGWKTSFFLSFGSLYFETMYNDAEDILNVND